MELTDLRTFVAVVNYGGITRAAKVLHRVPSSVTTRIAGLEEHLGVRLFLRAGKRMVLTGEGRTFFAYANRILDMVNQAEQEVAIQSPGGEFRLGAMESTAAVRLPKLLAKIHTRYPNIALKLSTGSSRMLYQHLIAGRLDAVFLADPPQDERLETEPAWLEELVIIAPATRRAVRSTADLQSMTILAFKDGCSYRARLFAWFRAYGVQPQKVAEFASYHAIMGAVAAGMGIGIVPRVVVAAFSGREVLSVHSMEHPLAWVPTCLAWKKGRHSPNIEVLRKSLAPTNLLSPAGSGMFD